MFPKLVACGPNETKYQHYSPSCHSRHIITLNWQDQRELRRIFLLYLGALMKNLELVTVNFEDFS